MAHTRYLEVSDVEPAEATMLGADDELYGVSGVASRIHAAVPGRAGEDCTPTDMAATPLRCKAEEGDAAQRRRSRVACV